MAEDTHEVWELYQFYASATEYAQGGPGWLSYDDPPEPYHHYEEFLYPCKDEETAKRFDSYIVDKLKNHRTYKFNPSTITCRHEHIHRIKAEGKIFEVQCVEITPQELIEEKYDYQI